MANNICIQIIHTHTYICIYPKSYPGSLILKRRLLTLLEKKMSGYSGYLEVKKISHLWLLLALKL